METVRGLLNHSNVTFGGYSAREIGYLCGEPSVVSNRNSLLDALADLIDAHQAADLVLDIDKSTANLSSKFPQSGFTLNEIAQIIESAAVERHVPLLAGNRRKDVTMRLQRRPRP